MWLKKMIIALCVAQTASAELTNGLYAAFETTMGSFTCRLDTAEAPLTCANFVGLAEGSQHWVSPEGAVRSDSFYDGLIFHRVIDGFMIQGGDPLGTGAGGPGYAFPDQISTNLTHHSAGILSMANSGPDSNGSQFFITLGPTTWLDGKHAVFGDVIDGMDTVYAIGSTAVTNGSVPLTNVVMQSVRILRVGPEAVAFDPAEYSLPIVESLNVMLAGGKLSSGSLNYCEQVLFSSTNLTQWAEWLTQYSQQASGDWEVSVPATKDCEFYKGVRVHYPLATTNEIAGSSFTLTLGSDIIILQPEEDGGSCSYNGDTGTITSWEFDSAYCGFLFYTDILVPLSLDFNFSSSSNGMYEGAYYNSGWNPISGPFIAQPHSP